MGNFTSSGQPEAATSQNASNPVESRRPTRKSPSPGQLDLSHFSADERAQIQCVLTRQLSFERKEQARVE